MDESAGVRLNHTDGDFPAPEVSHSYRLSKQEEREWVQETAAGNPQRAPSVNGSSQRLALKAKNPSIIGLPKLQRCGYTASCGLRPPRHRKTLFFPGQPPRRGSNAGRVVLPEMEPVSPKVSCIGSLDLKAKDKERKERLRQPPMAVTAGGGFFGRMTTKLCRGKKAVDCGEPKPTVEIRRKGDVAASVVPEELEEEAGAPTAVPPALGGMKKFSSCRKSALVARVLDSDDEDVESGTEMRYEMDLHVADRPAGHRRAAPCS